MTYLPLRLLAVSLASGFLFSTVAVAQTPSPKLALSFEPVHADVEYDIPKPEEIAKCEVQAEKNPFGWLVTNPGGQILRRYVDTNGDNRVDQWRYYMHGMEVYRDIDSDFNNKVDQSRWVNTGGSRWGIDRNEDGRIDEWKLLSAAEASREAVSAMVAGDPNRLAVLLITGEELKSLGLQETIRQAIEEEISNPSQKMRAVLSQSRGFNNRMRWSRFDGGMPALVPEDAGKADQDLWVYENGMAIVETVGANGTLQIVQIGEMVKVGEVWKLTQVPQPIDPNMQRVPGTPKIMQPEIPGINPGGGAAPNEAMQKLLVELQKLDDNSPKPGASAKDYATYNKNRADLLEAIVKASPDAETREQWLRQLVDGLAAAVQQGQYPEGLDRLDRIHQQFVKGAPKSPFVPYVAYRLLLARYSVELQTIKPDNRSKVQQWWQQQLINFVDEYPKSEDAAEAMVQLAISHEFAGEFDDAEGWWKKLAAQHGDSDAGQRAKGAIRRLTSEGQAMALAGPTLDGRKLSLANYRGRVTLVIFWSSWCRPCTADLPRIKELYKKYRQNGFEVVGVNLDSQKQAATEYVKAQQVPWPHIFEPGGLGSAPAQQFGIISLPTMFLVGKDGKVISKRMTVEQLSQDLPELLK